MKRPPKPLLTILFVFAFSALGFSSATNVYITPNGVAQGDCTTSPQTPAWFNSSANWGSGSNQIGPGTTVHLCGTFSFPAGSAGLLAQGSGASGNPITIYFESGTILQSPYFYNGGGIGGGAINVNNMSYITINGGSACTGLTGSGCGIIQNTNNGTAALGYAYQNATALLEFACAANITIENLAIINAYVAQAQDTAVAGSQSTFLALYGTDNGCSTTHMQNLVVNNNFINNCGWCVATYGNNIQFSNNNLSNFEHGIASGLGSTGYSGFYIFSNHIHDMAVWDWCGNGAPNHHDGIHLWGTSGPGGWSNVYIYNNQFDGNAGACYPNAWIYFEYELGPNYIFNNTFTSSPGSSFPSEVGPFASATNSVSMLYANNTLYDYNPTGCANNASIGNQTANLNLTYFNNISAGQYWSMSLKDTLTFTKGTALSGIDYNVYGNTPAACGQGYEFNVAGVDNGLNSITAWQSEIASYFGLSGATGRDLHSSVATNSQLNLSSSLTLQSGSVAVGAGTNFYSICNGQPNPGLGALCSDKAGNARPTSGAWDVGAYNFSSQGAPQAPTGLTAVVH